VGRKLVRDTHSHYRGGFGFWDNSNPKLSDRSGDGKMKTIASLSVPLFVGLMACAHPVPPASQAEIDAAMSDYANCLDKAAKQLDDGRSDVAVIALAIEPICADQFSRSTETQGRGMDPTDALYRDIVQGRQLQLATDAVLNVRSMRTQQN
jgi:hypothetical protein